MVVMRIDPDQSLYPDILAWPGTSGCGETVLVRRDHSQVTYLSPLRARSFDDFLMFSADQREVAAVAVTTGPGGASEGMDHRGEPVLAYLPWVGGTRWALVTKLDAKEVFARSDQAAFDLVVRTIPLLLPLALAGVLVHLVRQRRLLGRVLVAEHDRIKTAERYDRLLARATEIVLLVDPAGRIVDANAAASAAYGYDADTFRTMTEPQLRSPDAAGPVGTAAAAVGAAAVPEGDLVETAHRRQDGTTFLVEISTRTVDIDGVDHRESIVHDVTDRRRADLDLRRQVDELQRWRVGAIGREGRILELKVEVNDARVMNGQPPRYRSVLDGVDAHDA